jgi:Zn-dependent peptidase ImmA (M78 family)
MQDTQNIKVNPLLLVWARESIALTRNQVCEKTGISAKRLIHLETGEKAPSVEELKELSKIYKRTIATLLLTNPPKEKPLPKDQRTVNSAEVGIIHDKTIIAVRKARALAQSFIELKQEFNITVPKFEYSFSLKNDPKELASQLRHEWNLDEVRVIENINYALIGFIEKIESLGIAVFQLSLTQDNLRGFSITDDIIPIIGIKGGGEPTTAKIFTLFHEVGHILLNEGGLCDLSDTSNIMIEKWCNAFAAEILIPTTELLKMRIVVDHIEKNEKVWMKNTLIELGNHFHVGPLAILRSLLENDLTSVSYYKEKHQAWNKPQFGRSKGLEGRNPAKETIKEKGRTYISLAFQAFDNNRIDLKDLSDFLGVKMSYIPKTRLLLNV